MSHISEPPMRLSFTALPHNYSLTSVFHARSMKWDWVPGPCPSPLSVPWQSHASQGFNITTRWQPPNAGVRSRFCSQTLGPCGISYLTIDPDILISSHTFSSDLLPKTCSTCSLSPFQLMAAPFFHMLRPENLGIFFTWLSLLSLLVSQKILLALPSKHTQILFISHYSHCTILALSHLPLSWITGWASRLGSVLGLSFTLCTTL